jgi:hypothetical protein
MFTLQSFAVIVSIISECTLLLFLPHRSPFFAILALIGLCVSSKVRQRQEETDILIFSETSSLQPDYLNDECLI